MIKIENEDSNDLFFERLVSELGLGTIIKPICRISGGLTHKSYSLTTNTGKYFIKLLNPNIMKRKEALSNFKRTEIIEEVLNSNGIDAIYSLKFNDRKMQIIDSQYFYIFKFYNGKTLNHNEINIKHCEKISNVLSKIHNIDLRQEKTIYEEKYINWDYYISLAKDKNSIIYEMIYDKKDILYDFINNRNLLINKLPNISSICHNDLDPKNVMWIDSNFKIIDLECLDYSNPYVELFSLALSWAGFDECNIDYSLFSVFFETYFNNSKLTTDINWKAIYYSNIGMLEWLEYNIKRALMIECDTEEEQRLGIKEVDKAIKQIIYYYKSKNSILDNIINKKGK